MTVTGRARTALGAIVYDRVLDHESPGLVERGPALASLSMENERLEAEVRDALRRLRDAARRLVDAQDSERTRIVRDLHDGAQQRLASMAMNAARLELMSGDADRHAEQIRAVAHLLREESNRAVAAIHDLASGIADPLLAERGLGAALQEAADSTPLPVGVDVELAERLPDRVATTAYFVVSESLANTLKYADATEASVRVRSEDDRVEIRVTDNGRGGASKQAGRGLRGLDDRLMAVGGNLAVDSPQGAGTSIHASIPIRAET